ncbi:hypothetical protein [Sphingorhabdus sp.]|jgi:hypothetical protein|uniref:hypothetical protein n=1 Tax=Sphingorhabdus sp. TaxID=1902408 RepID=UPI0037CA8EAD
MNGNSCINKPTKIVPPNSVGLGGDGDEIDAIEDVERVFGVTLDKADAPYWLTAGDVYASLCRALPAEVPVDGDTWDRFTEALAYQTGVDPKLIEKDSPMLEHPFFWVQIADASLAIWITIGASILVLLAWSVL